MVQARCLSSLWTVLLVAATMLSTSADGATMMGMKMMMTMMSKGKGKGSYKGKGVPAKGKGKGGGCDVRAYVNKGITGVVFEDFNGNGHYDVGEPLVQGVMVSDGMNVVTTDNCGRYMLPYPTAEYEAEGFAVMVTKPDGYDVPLSDEYVPQFFYIHKPNGTPPNVRGEPFRFGGLQPTGPLPSYIDFALIKTAPMNKFKIVTSGDPQVYSNNELSYLRDSLVKEVCDMSDELAAVIIEGDVMGDELTMFSRFRQVLGRAGVPQYYVSGNHDMDFDSGDNKDSFDTFRNEFGPEYYSFDIGKVHFVIMNDVKYPCGPEDNEDGLHGHCDREDRQDYTGTIIERQMTWLKNDLAHVPKDRLIHLHMHIPIHSFIDQNLVKHSVANVVELYETLGCHRSSDGKFYPHDCERKIVSSHAHTHTAENIRPGEDFEGWSTALDSGTLKGRSPGPPPFHQVILGAGGGSWWTGDFNLQLIPESIQRLGAPRGYYIWEYDGSDYKETYKVPEYPLSNQMHMDILTPAFRKWFDELTGWYLADPAPGPDDVPPVNINDLPDTKIVETSELRDSMLMVNVWNGSRDSKVYAQVNGGHPLEMYRTNPGEGENMVEGLDVASLKRQLQVARHAYASTSGNDSAQGFEQFRGSAQCPVPGMACTPRPLGAWTWADQSSHLWQMPIPTHLGPGTHTVTISHYDWHGDVSYGKMMFEIADERPSPFFRTELFESLP